MKKELAEELTQAVSQSTSGAWRTIAGLKALGVPKALGLSEEEWLKKYLGRYVQLAVAERYQLLVDAKAAGLSNRQIAKAAGVGEATVRRNLRTNGQKPQRKQPEQRASAPKTAHPLSDLAAVAITEEQQAEIGKERAKAAAAAESRARREASHLHPSSGLLIVRGHIAGSTQGRHETRFDGPQTVVHVRSGKKLIASVHEEFFKNISTRSIRVVAMVRDERGDRSRDALPRRPSADPSEDSEAGALLGPGGASQALHLYLLGITYARQHLTDGFIPHAFVLSCGVVSKSGSIAKVLANRTIRLWRKVRGGYQIHDYHQWNPKASTVKEKRELDRQRKAQARGGAKPKPVQRGHFADSRARGIHESMKPVPERSKAVQAPACAGSLSLDPKGADRTRPRSP